MRLGRWMANFGLLCSLLVTGCGRKQEPGVIRKTGNAEIRQTSGIDLDALSADYHRWDLWFEAVNTSTLYLTSFQGARVALTSLKQPSPSACETVKPSQKRIPFADLSEGAHLCVLTNENRYGYIRIDKIRLPTGPSRDQSGSLTISYTVWEKK